MLPHSFTTDPVSQSQSLAATILTASSPPQISSACDAVDAFLHHHNPDQSRHFFSVAFPTLICKLFGFDESSSSNPNLPNGWIDVVFASKDRDVASRVFNLLSPDGVLMQSISDVDRQSLVKYVFPVERLPEWVRFALQSNRDCRILSDLCPLFKGRVKEDSIKGNSFQIHLNVFEYYMFWFAYYPVCKGNSDNSSKISVRKSRRFRLENWPSSFPGFVSSKRGTEQKTGFNLYMRLLYAYLRAFVPVYDLTAHQPYRSSLLHYSTIYNGSALLQAEFFVYTLIQFWIVDNDFSPMSVNACKSFGVSFPFRSVLSETPPIPGLGEVVTLFVKHLNLSAGAVTGGSDLVEYSGSPRWKASGPSDVIKMREITGVSTCLVSWNSLIQRPVYRLILRTFLFCTVGDSVKNVSQVLSLWVSYMGPWMTSLDDFPDLDSTGGKPAKFSSKEVSQSEACGYSSSWQSFVLSNYLFYSSLVMHFIGFAHKFLHTDAELIIEMVLKVMNVLTSSRELIELLKNVDTVFHSKQAGSGKSMLNSLCKFVPSICEQLQDWEDGLCESEADGSFLCENWNKDLCSLFSDGEDGGQQLFQLFILRAESELQAISGENLASNLQCIDTLKAQVSCLFGGSVIKPMLATTGVGLFQQSRDEIFKPRKVGSCTLADVRYKGDWMKRPISNDEVEWLAKLLVHLSDRLNENLGLGLSVGPENNHPSSTWSYVEMSGDVCGPVESMKAAWCCISSWILTWGMAVAGLMRKYGVRVNLRVLASKKVVMILLLTALFSVLRRAIRFQSV